MRPLYELGAAETVALLARGAVSSEAVVRACLDRIADQEPRVQAWEFLDPELALEQARRIDRLTPRPPLAGLPVGVKDIIDTADMPTACGSPVRRGHRPGADASCVAALRAAGAVVLGKLVTTEFAYFSPGKTRNPRDLARSPGGSSSGSAAAVADLMVPAALGSQTAGSVIRPASFCGVVGFKPSYGLLSLAGVQPFAPSLDTLGLFVRHVADLPILMRALGTNLGAGSRALPPRIGLCRTEQWPLAAAETRRMLEDAAGDLARAGAPVRDVELGSAFAGLPDAQKTIMAVEAARSLAEERRLHEPLLSPILRELIEQGEAIPPGRYRAALDHAEACRAKLPELFGGFDVLLTPSAPGEAPIGLASTGDPAFSRIWTLLHLPCVTIPGRLGPHGLPLGIQLVAGGDSDLLAAAGWIAERLEGCLEAKG